MKTIIYKKRGRLYECISIIDAPTSEARIVFEEPLDAKIKFASRLLTLKKGVAAFDLCDFPNGEYSPELISAGYTAKMEALLIKDGAVSRKALGEDYIRELSRRCEELEERLSEAESTISDLSRKIENTIDL